MIVRIYSGPRMYVEKEVARSLGVKENEAKGWKQMVKIPASQAIEYIQTKVMYLSDLTIILIIT